MTTAASTRRPRGVLTFLVIWCLLQLPRLVAIPLIQDVAAGRDDSAWMYPAILDIVVAVTAIPVAWLLWKRRGLLPFVAGVVFLVVSMVDHGDAVTAAFLSPTPHVFGGPNGSASGRVVPALQAVGDLAALWLLTKPSTRVWLRLLPAAGKTAA
ncbi:MAG TPA: hypothetical protein PKL25_06320 [Phycicoccus elongatus]|nr:hypothetical protein [Phycicoccus elongatus]